MPSVYRAADVVVVPSKSIPHWQEQFGMVVAEAMASGLPVIGSDSGAIPEVLGSAGVVVRAGSVPALTEALDSLLADDAARRRMGAAARRRAVETLDARKAARSLASAYLRVAA
jgi:glycosyltransferase involved in cell wall biosynthesis